MSPPYTLNSDSFLDFPCFDDLNSSEDYWSDIFHILLRTFQIYTKEEKLLNLILSMPHFFLLFLLMYFTVKFHL